MNLLIYFLAADVASDLLMWALGFGGHGLRWTKVRPTQEGWYWIRHPEISVRVCKFYYLYGRDSSILCHEYEWSNIHRKKNEAYEYAGPIIQP